MLMYGARPVPVATKTRFWSGDTESSVNMPVIFGILNSELKGYTDRLDVVWKTNLAAVNKELARLKLPPLDPQCVKAEGCVVVQ